MSATYNGAINAISKIAYSIAGSGQKFYKLPKDKRTEIRYLATQLHEAGRMVGSSEIFEETNKQGFVYVIQHPRLQGVKVGRACDPEARLRGYQTGCPRREYELKYADYFEDCYAAEAAVHARLNTHQLEGEWFAVAADEALEAIEAESRLITHQLENT